MYKGIKNKVLSILNLAVKNSGSLFLVKIFGICINYLALLLVLEYFGFSVNGELANFIAQSKGIMIVLIFGLDIVLVKKLNEKSNRIDSVFMTLKALTFNVLIFSAFAILINLFYNVGYAFFIGGVFLAIWRYIGHFYRGKNNMILYGLFEFVLFQSTILFAVFLSEYYNFKLVDSVIAINIILIIIAMLFFGTKYFSIITKYFFKTINLKELLRLYKESFHFVLSSSIVILSTSVVYILIKSYYSVEILGIYDTVLKMSQIVLLPLIATSGRVMTITSKYFNTNNLVELKSYILKITKMLVFTSSFCAFMVIIIYYIYSEYFNLFLQSYWFLFLFMILAQLINNWAGPVGVVLQLTNNEKVFNLITFLSSLYLVISTLIASMFFNIEYIAINYVIYIILQNYFSLIVMKKKLSINLYKI